MDPAIRLRRPGLDAVRRFLESQRDLPFSYEAVGATRGSPPPGFTVDHNRVELGHGEETWNRARAALRAWTMFRIPWLELHPPAEPVEEGSCVVVLTRQCGLWWMNASRIVYTIDEVGPSRRYGFAYGTLPGHAERGEERFTVECGVDGSVWYDLFAFSRPHFEVVRWARPLARHLQRRFAADSLAAMREAVSGAGARFEDVGWR